METETNSCSIVSVFCLQTPDGGIGNNNQLIYTSKDLPGDMARFKGFSIGETGEVNIMGRKNWDSIPERFKPFGDGRVTIVVSRHEHPEISRHKDCFVAHSPLEALELAKFLIDRVYPGKNIVVGGGGEIYQALFPYCHKLYTTEVHGDRIADVKVSIPDYYQRVSYEIIREQQPSYSFAEYVNTNVLPC